MKLLTSVALIAALFTGIAQGQIFNLRDKNNINTQNIPNINGGTATVAFEPFDPGVNHPDLPSFLLITRTRGVTYEARGQGGWTFHNVFYEDPYEFDPATFSATGNLPINVSDVVVVDDRFNPDDFTYMVGRSGGNFYVFGMVTWIAGNGITNLRIPAAYTVILDDDEEEIVIIENFEPNGTSTVLVPEPATAGVLLLGASLLALRRRQRRLA
ncbi:MAG: PEP-CTERM sorting domain-containing protein [Verrucomicrobiota bacterium]